jgi:hypothetical protein
MDGDGPNCGNQSARGENEVCSTGSSSQQSVKSVKSVIFYCACFPLFLFLNREAYNPDGGAGRGHSKISLTSLTSLTGDELSLRNDNLGWSHHRAAANLAMIGADIGAIVRCGDSE